MLQVTFKNLLPSEELVGAANAAYLTLRDRADVPGRRLRCNVTISTEQRAADRANWICVQVEVVPASGRALRVVAEGADAQLVIRSGVLAAAPCGVPLRTQVQEAAC